MCLLHDPATTGASGRGPRSLRVGLHTGSRHSGLIPRRSGASDVLFRPIKSSCSAVSNVSIFATIAPSPARRRARRSIACWPLSARRKRWTRTAALILATAGGSRSAARRVCRGRRTFLRYVHHERPRAAHAVARHVGEPPLTARPRRSADRFLGAARNPSHCHNEPRYAAASVA